MPNVNEGEDDDADQNFGWYTKYFLSNKILPGRQNLFFKEILTKSLNKILASRQNRSTKSSQVNKIYRMKCLI